MKMINVGTPSDLTVGRGETSPGMTINLPWSPRDSLGQTLNSPWGGRRHPWRPPVLRRP